MGGMAQTVSHSAVLVVVMYAAKQMAVVHVNMDGQGPGVTHAQMEDLVHSASHSAVLVVVMYAAK